MAEKRIQVKTTCWFVTNEASAAPGTIVEVLEEVGMKWISEGRAEAVKTSQVSEKAIKPTAGIEKKTKK